METLRNFIEMLIRIIKIITNYIIFLTMPVWIWAISWYMFATKKGWKDKAYTGKDWYWGKIR